MAGRGLNKALRASDVVFRSTFTDISRRAFTSSARRQAKGSVPVFADASSPELDEILATFRTKVFLPASLSKAQRDLIYKDKHKRMISTEPVAAKVGGEEFQLEHIDRTRDVPNFRRGLAKILRLMQDKRDWDNLIPFLSGIKRAGIKGILPQCYMIVAGAADAGRLDVVLACAQSASTTGFALNDLLLVEKLVLKIRESAVRSDWNTKETEKALSWVERISVMLEEEKHGWSKTAPKEGDPRVSPVLAGSLLELSAVRAARHFDGKDEEGKVARFAETLLSIPSWTSIAEKSRDGSQALHQTNRWVRSTIPIVHGIKVAMTVLDPTSEVAQKLETEESRLRKLVTQEIEFIHNNSSEVAQFRGKALSDYDQLLG